MIVLLAGGTGGAKLARGMSSHLSAGEMAVISNTGDDFFRFGLRICPDVDSLLYLLSGRLNPVTGWGLAEDSFRCLAQLQEWGEQTWFQIGDRDLAMHLLRNQLLEESSLTEVTAELARRLGVAARVLPMSDGFLPTFLATDKGRLHIQEYFVREKCRPRVFQVLPLESDSAGISEKVGAVLDRARSVILGPSNPFISIGPILRTPGFAPRLRQCGVRVSAVSPIVGGRALKGPTAKMLAELGHPVSVVGIAQVYAGFIDCLIIDRSDRIHVADLEAMGLEVVVIDTVMSSPESESRTAGQVLQFA